MVNDENVKIDYSVLGNLDTVVGDGGNATSVVESAQTVEPADVIGTVADGIAYKDEFTTPEAAILCGLSVMRAKQYARSRNLPRFGRAYRWTREDVEDMRARKMKRD